MKGMTAVVIGLSSVVCLSGQSAKSGLHVVLKVEARQIPGQEVTEQSSRIVETQFPDGSAKLELITDGQAVRASVTGEMFGLKDGTVRLVPRGSSNLYVLNPATRTYHLYKPGTLDGQKPEFSVKATGVYRSILGYRAQKVTASYRQIAKMPFGSPDGKNALEVRAEFENWCTNALKVPAAMADMMNFVERLAGWAGMLYDRTCPLSLESVMRVSIFPGFEIVSTTQSVRQTSQFPAGAFELPADFRELPARGQSPPR